LSQLEESGSALDISLHPLVIINISDHYTREKVSKENARVFGILLGTQKGRKVEVSTSFAILLTKENVVDNEYLSTKIEQFKKVFEDYELLGWYSTSSNIQSYDMDVHQQIMKFNESPLYLILDPLSILSRELPLTLLEAGIKIENDAPVLRFAKVTYKIETTDAERIAVDHVAKTNSGEEGSKLTTHLYNMFNAIKMLNIRVKLIIAFLEQQKSGQIPVDYSLLRRINSLTNLLPTIDGDSFTQEFLNEYNDTLLSTYLSSITKASDALNELIDKFNVTYDRNTRRRGFY